MKIFSVTSLLALLAVASAQQRKGNVVHEQIKELRAHTFNKLKKEHIVKMLSDRHDRRLEKLGQLLDERKEQLENHKSGRVLLARPDHERITRQVRSFEMKLDDLKNRDEETHRQMLEDEADGFHNLNRVDYLNFDA